ncbi:MAG: hypothetical protein JO242_22165 [Streptosporangiaceae bacterium]|nr:hypothetical protein [Streptosporangiaceae bacterium]
MNRLSVYGVLPDSDPDRGPDGGIWFEITTDVPPAGGRIERRNGLPRTSSRADDAGLMIGA